MRYIQDCYRQILNSGETVCIYIDATLDGVNAPNEYIEDGKIVLDISPRAISKFIWSENAMQFLVKFKGRSQEIKVPLSSLLTIYCSKTKIDYEFNRE